MPSSTNTKTQYTRYCDSCSEKFVTSLRNRWKCPICSMGLDKFEPIQKPYKSKLTKQEPLPVYTRGCNNCSKLFETSSIQQWLCPPCFDKYIEHMKNLNDNLCPTCGTTRNICGCTKRKGNPGKPKSQRNINFNEDFI